MIKVSVIIPIYNTPENLLRNCISSVLNQSEKNFEIILVNDGSTNNVMEVLKSYEHLDNIHIISQKNQGVSVARNAGFEIACGEWVMFVDPDDELVSDSLEVLLSNVKDSEDDIVIGCYINDDGIKQTYEFFFENEKTFSNEEQKKEVYYRLLWKLSNIGAPWGKIFRRSFLQEKNILFKPELRRAQDIVFNLYALYNCRCCRYIPIPVYIYNNVHMADFHAEYKNGLDELYALFAEARYTWMLDTDNFKDRELSEFYLNGAYDILFQILSVGAFHKKNLISYKQRKKIANEFCKQKSFQVFFDKKQSRMKQKNSIKMRIIHFVLKYRLWCILYIKFILKSR